MLSGEPEKKSQNSSTAENLRKAEQTYFKRKLILDQQLLQLEKKKYSIDKKMKHNVLNFSK
jgi:hypothetical protein